MIGTRAALSAALAVAVLPPLLGPTLADPAAVSGARRVVHDRAVEAVEALESLRLVLGPGLDAARVGAAAVLAGDEPPGVEISRSVDLLSDAVSSGDAARAAIQQLEGARRAWHADPAPIAPPVGAGEIASIAAQLGDTTEAANAFAARRRAATGLPARLEQALGALDRGSLPTAAAQVALARADHHAVAASEASHPALPLWIETTDAMIGAMESILEAVRAGDDLAAAEAADDFAALANEAATADRALRIALAEGGSALTAAPLERLAGLMAEIDAVLAATTAIAQATEP